jgi:hypothetical protein
MQPQCFLFIFAAQPTKHFGMKLKFFSLLFVCAVLASNGFAQRMITKSNVLFGPFVRTIHTIQEVKVAPRLTVQTTVKTRLPTEFRFFNLGSINMEGRAYEHFGKTKLSAVGNVTEFRVYGKEKGAFHGFYFGPYFSYMHYRLQSSSFRGEFHDVSDNAYYADISHSVRLNSTGGGFQIGTQGMYFKNKFCIDWTILGVGFGVMSFKGTIDAENTSGNFDFRNYEEDINKVEMGIERVFNFKRKVDPTSIEIGAKIPMISMRMGLSIGFGYGRDLKLKKPEQAEKMKEEAEKAEKEKEQAEKIKEQAEKEKEKKEKEEKEKEEDEEKSDD